MEMCHIIWHSLFLPQKLKGRYYTNSLSCAFAWVPIAHIKKVQASPSVFYKEYNIHKILWCLESTLCDVTIREFE